MLSNEWNNSNISKNILNRPEGPQVGTEIALQLSHWSRNVVIQQCIAYIYQKNECRYACNIIEGGNYSESNVSFVAVFPMGKFFIALKECVIGVLAISAICLMLELS